MALYFGPSNDRYRVREPLGSKAAFLCLVSLGAGLNCAVMVTGVKGMGKSAVVGVFSLQWWRTQVVFTCMFNVVSLG